MSYALIQQRHYAYTYVTLQGKPHITELCELKTDLY